jgi:fermentation-respiration switch protein FrsA (DUF1100 family)
VVAAVALLVAVAIAVLGAGGSAEPRGDGDGRGVGRRDVTFVDPGRPTAAVPEEDVEARPDRTLDTVVLYPTANVEASSASTDVRPAGPPAAEGPFPLVVFSHGNGGDPELYVPLVEPLVREGYVVALPRFPLTSLSGEALADVVNQPADVSFVIDQLLALSDRPDGWLAGRVDAERIAAAGHSLGAVTTLALAYDDCCVDPRVDAALAVSGVAVPSGPGTLDDPPPTPLLLVHGAEDATVPVTGSDDLFARATGPAYYLRLDDGDHTDIGFGDDGDLTREAMEAFLSAELEADPGPLAALPDDVAESGRGAWQERNVPATAGAG